MLGNLKYKHIKQPNIGDSISTLEAMQWALAEASRGAGFVSPNPLVGCVIVDEQHCFLSSGYHRLYGKAHAEVDAVQNLQDVSLLKNATVYVTLEPCAHEGKTPSCAKMLAKFPLKKVVYGLKDPNPLVAGQGAQILKDHGIQAVTYFEETGDSSLQVSLYEICEIFLRNFIEKKIFVAVKMASSLDGCLALENGQSQWITGPESREYSHYLRSLYDGTMIGSKTLEIDNPGLNIRHPHIQKENKIIILDTKGELLTRWKSFKISELNLPKNLYWCVGFGILNPDVIKTCNMDTEHPHVIECEITEDFLNLDSVLENLFKMGLKSIFVEGGANLISEFLRLQKVQRMYLFQAPKILGSQKARRWSQTLNFESMLDTVNLQNSEIYRLGNDMLWTGNPHQGPVSRA